MFCCDCCLCLRTESPLALSFLPTFFQVLDQSHGSRGKPREKLLPPHLSPGRPNRGSGTTTNSFHAPGCRPNQSVNSWPFCLSSSASRLSRRQFVTRIWRPSISMCPCLQPQHFHRPLSAWWGLEATFCAAPCGQCQVRRGLKRSLKGTSDSEASNSFLSRWLGCLLPLMEEAAWMEQETNKQATKTGARVWATLNINTNFLYALASVLHPLLSPQICLYYCWPQILWQLWPTHLSTQF